MDDTKFIVWAPSYTERDGGILLLHYLCHYLNQSGFKSKLWHSGKLAKGSSSLRRRSLYLLKGTKRKILCKPRTSSHLSTPLAKQNDIENAIVIYPETISGNPLNAKKVVRWALHRPGYHNKRTDYGSGEIMAYYQSVFKEAERPNVLYLPLFFNVIIPVFRRTNLNRRKGICFILRKGRRRDIHHDLSAGQIVDDLSHTDMARVFNECEYCVSYDTQSFYSFYASICGCKSIVVPEDGVSKYEWRHEESLRYGVAYGEEDVGWAEETTPQLIEFIEKNQSSAVSKVGDFAALVSSYFESAK